jgi:hypothetical protein
MNTTCSVVEHVLSTDAERRFAGKQVGLGLISSLRNGWITFDDMDEVMGVDDHLFRLGLAREETEKYWRWKEDATRLLGDWAQGDGDTMKKWAWSEDMVTVLYVYHVVSWLRLHATGKLPALSVTHLPSPWTHGGA